MTRVVDQPRQAGTLSSCYDVCAVLLLACVERRRDVVGRIHPGEGPRQSRDVFQGDCSGFGRLWDPGDLVIAVNERAHSCAVPGERLDDPLARLTCGADDGY